MRRTPPLARTIALLLAVLASWSARAADRYADPLATGNGTGTSWSNAYTTLAAAFSALNAGDTLHSRGTFYELVSKSNLDNVTWIGNEYLQGTRIFGLRSVAEGDLTDETGGVFSFALTGGCATVTWDYKQDNAAGAVTGVTLSGTELGNAFATAGMTVPTFAGAWYGHLVEEVSTPTTPGDGEWGYSSNVVYINPPGSPTAAQIATLMRYGALGSGVNLINCDKWTIRGVYCIAHGDEAEGRGSFYFNGCKQITIEDCISWDAGYRAYNFAGATGDDGPVGHTVRRCIAAGDSMPNKASNDTQFPLVFYNAEGSPVSGVRTYDVTIISYPWLGTGGAPTYTAYKSSGLYSHDGGGAATGMGDMEHTRLALISMSQALNAKHTLGMLWDPVAAQIPSTDVPAFTSTDPDSYPIRIRRGVVYGELGTMQNVSMRHVVAVVPTPGGSLSNYEGLSKQNWLQIGSGTSTYLEGCALLFRRHAETNHAMVNCLGGNLYMDSCLVALISTGNSFSTDAIFRHSGSTSPLQVRNCVFWRSTEAADCPFVYRAGGTDFQGLDFSNNWFDNFGTSGGAANWYRNATGDDTLAAWITAMDTGSDEIYHTDPGIASASTGDLRLSSSSVLLSSYQAAPLAALDGFAGLAEGTAYAGRWGPWQDAYWGSQLVSWGTGASVFSLNVTVGTSWSAATAVTTKWRSVQVRLPATNTDDVRVRFGGGASVLWPAGYEATLTNVDLSKLEVLGTAGDQVLILAQID